MWILALINVSGIVSRFWVRVHEIGHIEIKAYKINHLLSFIIIRHLNIDIYMINYRILFTFLINRGHMIRLIHVDKYNIKIEYRIV